jgi:hypothetical protein
MSTTELEMSTSDPVQSAVEEVDTHRLEELETVIRQGLKAFTEVGNALMEIRASKLYRKTLETTS